MEITAIKTLLVRIFASATILISSSCLAEARDTEEKPLLLEVIINGISTGKIGEFIWRDKRLFARKSELNEVGLRTFDSDRASEEALISLNDLTGLIWQLDEPRQSLFVTASDVFVLPKIIQGRIAAADRIPVESGTGVSINYDVLGSRSGGKSAVSGAFDLRAFSPFGTLSSGALVNPFVGFADKTAPVEFVRLDTTYRLTSPDEMMSYRAGDFISSGLSWSRPVRLGGAQISSDFLLRPDLVTMPLPSVSGTVSVPSTLDVMVNGIRAFSTQVQPGAFAVPQIPVVSGANTITVALTNALGQQIAEQLPFYGGASLLAPGLQSYSAEVGFVRRNWGLISNDYGDLAASATWLRGLSLGFTAEAHAEMTTGLFLAGGGGKLNVFDYAILNLNLTGSTGVAGNGAQLSVGLSRISPSWSIGASVVKTISNFDDLAAINGEPVPALQLNANVGLSLSKFGSLGMAYSQIDRPMSVFLASNAQMSRSIGGLNILPSEQYARILSVSYTLQIHQQSLYATTFHDFSSGDSGLMIGLAIPLGGRSSVGVDVSTGKGSAYRQIEVNQSAVEVGDWGYQAYGSDGIQSHQYGLVQYKSPWSMVSVGVDNVGGQTTARVEGQGSLSYADGALFASNTINDAFGIVDTNGIANVRVFDEHREVGRTNQEGLLLVPDLRSFDVNHLEIDPVDVPMDATVVNPTQNVRPQHRSGLVINFGIRFGKGALLRLVDEFGDPLPVGGLAVIKSTNVSSPIGFDGEAFLDNLESQNELIVDKPDGRRCFAMFAYHPIPGTIPTLGPLICREEQ